MSPYVAKLRSIMGSDRLLLPSVTVLPRDRTGRLLLVRQADDGLWGTIGGTVEIGESPADAAIREAREEANIDVALTGIVAAVGGPRFEVTYPNGDRTAYVAVVYDAEIVGGAPAPDHDETTEVGWFTGAELPGLTVGSYARNLFAELGLSAR